jgi:hypothetical protein
MYGVLGSLPAEWANLERKVLAEVVTTEGFGPFLMRVHVCRLLFRQIRPADIQGGEEYIVSCNVDARACGSLQGNIANQQKISWSRKIGFFVTCRRLAHLI